MHPLLRLIATQPQMLADHAEAYAELVSSDIVDALSGWKRSVILNAVALACIAVAAGLAGVALMLWAVVPVETSRAPWALIATPVFFVVVALSCVFKARAKTTDSVFDNVRQQVKADLLMLREATHYGSTS